MGGASTNWEEDPDRDGLNNLGEMGFGTNPNGLPDEPARLPRLSPGPDSTMCYARRVNVADEALVLSFVEEWSTDLQSWVAGSASREVTATTRDGYELIKARPPAQFDDAEVLFVRVRVERVDQ